MKEVLGKITSARFGIGGYNDAMIGLHLLFEFKGGGVSWNKVTWDCNIVKCNEDCDWDELARGEEYSNIIRELSKLLYDAKVKNVKDLVGVPVRLFFDGNSLSKFDILTEVL